MSIKDLFGKSSNKVVTKAQVERLYEEVESPSFVEQSAAKDKKLVTRIDYSKPENFARYGSAEKYYEDSLKYIYDSYPYDGSSAEKLDWRKHAAGIDEYIYDVEYPKTVGHVLLNGITELDSSHAEVGVGTFYRYKSPQWIKIKGGPNKDPSVEEGDEYELSKQFPPKGGRANIWDENLFQESNLGINPAYGNTIEFWSKFDYDFISNEQAACLFDLWNGVPHDSAEYVRLMIEILPNTGNDFSITYKYGSAAEGVTRAAVNLTSATKAALGADWRTNWNHYSFAISNSSSGITIKLYVNGAYESAVTVGNEITSTLPQTGYIAAINALRTLPTLSSPSTLREGDGGAPAFSIDEFRFWKTSRNAKQIGRHWFTTVNGGTNTDVSKYDKLGGDKIDLGVYYKFNEGIMDTENVDRQDAQCLDYSGRISNGFINNYSLGTRYTTSAIDLSTVAADAKETPDPIMYPTHPSVLAKKKELQMSGSAWDMQNNASFYHTMPGWILNEDQNGLVIKELAQTLSSYFDTVHAQIETLTEISDAKYLDLSDSQNKPFFFAKQLLRSVGFDVSDIFGEATTLQEIASRSEKEEYDLRIQEVKNVIYQNIYNNISYIYKSKGTEKSFRNFIRCFGVDDELIKLNLYADGVDYTLDGRYSYTALKKNYVDFNNIDREEACVYSRDHSPTESDVRAYIGTDAIDGALTDAEAAHLSTTITAEVIFPRQLDLTHPKFDGKDFSTVSLFGSREANIAGGTLYDEAGLANPVRFKVEAIRPNPESLHAKFRLTCTDKDGTTHTLTSDEYKEVYDNTKWNFAVRLTPTGAPLADYVDGSTITNYNLEFYGVQMSLDVVENEFTKSTTLSTTKGLAIVKVPKIMYCGHYRTDFATKITGTTKSDVKITDIMYWFDYLSDLEIKSHAKDAGNAGRLHPNEEAYAFFSQLSSGTTTDLRVPRRDTLALHWDFTNVKKSDAASEFTVNDVSFGGADYIAENRYGWFTKLVGYRHQGMGSFNPAIPNDTQVINREYQHTAKQRLPEVLSGDDMVEIRTQDDLVFTKDSRPINHFFAIEKSMYQVISDDMMNLFATIAEFNDLIGQPVNRYRMQYKSLQKFRSLFYEKVENTPSFEKYVEFYKWIDSSIGLMMQQLIPASGNFSESVRNMVENHILERSKYWTKFPTLEMKQDPPEGTIRGIRELTYDWEHGHAPLDPATAQTESCLWHNERAERDNARVTSSDSDVDKDREAIRKSAVRDILGQNKMVPVGTDGFVEQGDPTLYDIVTSSQYEGSTYATRRLSRPYKLNLEKQQTITGGPNFAEATLHSPNDMFRAATHTGTSIKLTRTVDDADSCRDEFDIEGGPIKKIRRAHVVTLTDFASVETEVKGSLFSPPYYGGYPSEVVSNTSVMNTNHDSYGQDHEIPMQGPFTNQWVGGNQHRHIDLNDGTVTTGGGFDKTNRPELYLESAGIFMHPNDVNTAYPSARYTRDGMAKRPMNIANVNTKLNKDTYENFEGTRKLGNYTRDYEIVQTVGRSQNNRWLVRNPDSSANNVTSTYVDGLRDYTLPVRGRTEHVFVQRFSAPGSPATLSRGALDYQAEEFSPYNSLNYRNLRVRQHLNFWQKEHAAQFGYREDYIHGTPDDAINGVSNDFGGNTADVGSWHKNNRNPRTRMHLQQPNIESRRRYDNFYISHQIPQSDWQYHWITSSAMHFSAIVEYDDEQRSAYTPTTFNTGDPRQLHPRLSGYVTNYSNATIGSNGSLDLLYSSSFAVDYFNDGTLSREHVDIDFVYGNGIVVDRISWRENTIGTCLQDCESNVRKIAGLPDNQISLEAKELNALLLNRNGPYQGASWKMLKNVENPIVRQTRRRNIIMMQDEPGEVRKFTIEKPAKSAKIYLVIKAVPSNNFTLRARWVHRGTTVDVPVEVSGTTNEKEIAKRVVEKIRSAQGGSTPRLRAKVSDGKSIVEISTTDAVSPDTVAEVKLIINQADVTVAADALTDSSKVYFMQPPKQDGKLDVNRVLVTDKLDTDGSNKIVTANLTGGTAKQITTVDYKDKRAATHRKYLEPAAIWNKPMVHIVSEKSDPSGVKVTYSYSNNLKMFSNPNLTYRLDLFKSDNQFYDFLFDSYSPTRAEKPSLDFVSVSYKEFIFPKNRNVGLLKIRNRVKWDDITSRTVDYATGDVRIFWKDDYSNRMRNYNSLNAIGYANNITAPYLLGSTSEGLSKERENWYVRNSIFSMDNFRYNDASLRVWRVLGDLQYVGAARYLSWIVNQNCKYAASDTINIGNFTIQLGPDGLRPPANDAIEAVQNALSVDQGKSRVMTAKSASEDQSSPGTMTTTKAIRVPTSETEADIFARQELSARLLGVDIFTKVNGEEGTPQRMDIANLKDALDKLGPASVSDEFLKDLKIPKRKSPAVITKDIIISPRCEPPTPAIQLYYNAWSPDKYREEAWLYRANQLAYKNPWYNNYKKFNLDIRSIAQNFGLVAEFRVSEHMNKYVLENGGDFRAKNYNFLSLHGASYTTQSPHIAYTATEYSGKVTYPASSIIYSIDGTQENVASQFIHADDMFSWYNSYNNNDFSVDLDSVDRVRSDLMIQNNAYSLTKPLGTYPYGDKALAVYDDYFLQNQIFAGGAMTIENSVVADMMLSISSTTPFSGRPSWGDEVNDITGTGRHQFFSNEEALADDEASGYEDMRYREPLSFNSWEPVTPRSYGPIASLKFNMNGAIEEYLHGIITLWDKQTESTTLDTDIRSISPFSTLAYSTIANSTYRTIQLPSGVDRKEFNLRQGGTPFTVSVWAKPEDTDVCSEVQRYDGKPKGLYVFGNYILDTVDSSTVSAAQREGRSLKTYSDGGWRKSIVKSGGVFGLFSNYPMPVVDDSGSPFSKEEVQGMREQYSEGMGLTFFVVPPKATNQREGQMAYFENAGTESEGDSSGIDIYHFFRRRKNSVDGTYSYEPAVLSEGQWSQVILQVLPPVDSAQQPKIKLILKQLGDNTGNDSNLVLNGDVLYGVHRSALKNNTHVKMGYAACPIGRTQVVHGGHPWGVDYGSPVKYSKNTRRIKHYKLGKSNFHDRYDGGLFNQEKIEEQFLFHGELTEFCMFSGVLSEYDVKWFKDTPQNVLEGLLNGEVIGGYTSRATINNEWGASAPSIEIPADFHRGGATAITYLQRFGSTSPSRQNFLDASRSTCDLPIWHRLGVNPIYDALEKCEDWDDEFFNSYVHTDTLQFYDTVVEDHDVVSDTIKKRIGIKVNALKKLMPYRGFYPQDRTLQLAKLFKEKMIDSIVGEDAAVLHEEQAMQAVLQPFFAPGILYNSIKAGVAVDWPAFTNETGLEPTTPNSSVKLPYYQEDILGRRGDETATTAGPEISTTSIVPNWYSPRENQYSPSEGLAVAIELKQVRGGGDLITLGDDIRKLQNLQYNKLQSVQPKFTNRAVTFDETRSNAATEKIIASTTNLMGYVILTEPSTRIPFEGLVAIDSVLPSASDYEGATTQKKRLFKHIDLEISGWDTEGVEITLSQPEPITGYTDIRSYPMSDDEFSDNWMMKNVSVTIGDPGREIGSEDWDVGINFRRAPKGFVVPSFGQDGTVINTDEAWSLGEGTVTTDELNEEIAVNLCREINKRQDIHFVAIPGYLYNHEYVVGAAFMDALAPGQTDDHIARLFPVCYPEVCDINPDDFREGLNNGDSTLDEALRDPADVEGYYASQFNKVGQRIWAGGNSRSTPKIGRQRNGTWRIRLVYVGPPKLELNMASVNLHESILWQTDTGFTDVLPLNPNGERKFDSIAKRPFHAINFRDEEDNESLMLYNPKNPEHYNLDAANFHGFINGVQFFEKGNMASVDEVTDHIRAQGNYLVNGRGWGVGLNGWKEMHLVNPFRWRTFLDGVPALGELPTGWMTSGDTLPYSFFTGGGAKAYSDEDDETVMADLVGVSVTRHLGTLKQCKFIDGYGWKGAAKYSIDTELGIRCVSEKGVTIKGNLNDRARMDMVHGRNKKRGIFGIGIGLPMGHLINEKRAVANDSSAGIDKVIGGRGSSAGGATVLMEESAKPQQGPFVLYGGYSVGETIRVTPKPYQMYLMTPEYYMGHQAGGDGGPRNDEWAKNWRNYSYPYFEYLGSNGDPRFEMAMHNFLAEVPNFFLQDSKLVSFVSSPESEFQVMNAGTTYSMNVTMYQSEKFCTTASPHSSVIALGNPKAISNQIEKGNRLTMEGRYYGPAFLWKDRDDYNLLSDGGNDELAKQLIRDPAQAPYVPPYMYGKAVARISFTPMETRQYSLQEIFAGVHVDNTSIEQVNRFKVCALEDSPGDEININGILNSPAYKARTTISSSMNLFGRSNVKILRYQATQGNLTDDLDESLHRFVPQSATDPQNANSDVWVIGTKFECPILNFYKNESLSTMASMLTQLRDNTFFPSILPSTQPHVMSDRLIDQISMGKNQSISVAKKTIEAAKNAVDRTLLLNKKLGGDITRAAIQREARNTNMTNISSVLASTVGTINNSFSAASGMGIWSSYGEIPSSETGVFVTLEEASKLRKDFKKPKQGKSGSLIDVCGFTAQKQKVGAIASEKQISEAVVMIPFIDTPTDSASETVQVDGRHFFKINKDLFNLQKNNIENGKNAINKGEYAGVSEDIPETSISQMIRRMKKYNLPPKFDFIRYPMRSSEHPFVMYIFEFNHTLTQQDLADIWQGLPPTISLTSELDSSMIMHDMSPVDFFENRALPKNVRWMTFKIKQRAKQDYFDTVRSAVDDRRFQFNFEFGRTSSKYSYNWPYDYFTMLEMIQVEAGVEILENKRVQASPSMMVVSQQDEISTSQIREQINQIQSESTQDTSDSSTVSPFVFGDDKDRE